MRVRPAGGVTEDASARAMTAGLAFPIVYPLLASMRKSAFRVASSMLSDCMLNETPVLSSLRLGTGVFDVILSNEMSDTGIFICSETSLRNVTLKSLSITAALTFKSNATIDSTFCFDGFRFSILSFSTQKALHPCKTKRTKHWDLQKGF